MVKVGFFAPVLLLILAACDNSGPAPPKATSPPEVKAVAPVKPPLPAEDFGQCRQYDYGAQQEERIKACSALIEKNAAGNTVLVEPRRRRADAYRQAKDYERAIADLSKALELSPESAKTYYQLGEVHEGKKETERALTYYTKAIEVDRRYVDAFVARARLHRDTGNSQQEKADRQRVIDIRTEEIDKDPKRPWPYLMRANAYRDAGDLTHALADLSTAIALAPGEEYFIPGVESFTGA